MFNDGYDFIFSRLENPETETGKGGKFSNFCSVYMFIFHGLISG